MQASEALVAGAHSRLRRLDLRVAIGLLLMTVAVLGGASLIRNAQARTPVLVAAGSVQPGEVIEASDLRVAEISLPAGVSYLSASMEGEIEGRVAAEPLWDGKVLGPGSVAETPPLAAGMVAITLLLPPESAVGGGVRAGDNVAVLSSPGVNEAGGDQAELGDDHLADRGPGALRSPGEHRRGRGPAGHPDASTRGGPSGRGSQSLGTRRPRPAPRRDQLSAIAVCSGKGSPGATFVAANLAAALSRANEETVLLDLDPAGGDLCCYLGLDPRRGLYPLLRMEGSISGTAAGSSTEAEERSGFRVVGGFPESSELASTGVLAGALAAASASGRIVVADLGRVFETNAPIAAKCGARSARRAGRSGVGPRSGAGAAAVGGRRHATESGSPSSSPATRRRRPADLAEVGEALRLPVLGAVPLDRRGARKALLSQRPAATRRLRQSLRCSVGRRLVGPSPRSAANARCRCPSSRR